MNDPGLELVLWGTASAVAGALVLVIVWGARSKTTVGRPLLVRQPGRRSRALVVAALLPTAALVVVSGVPQTPALVLLSAVAGLAALSPGFLDSIYGESGVRRGWHARPYTELEEWRLTGAHLRWRLFGEWLACEVPISEHEALRARLKKLCPGRESSFER